MKQGDDAVIRFHAGRAHGEWLMTALDIAEALVDVDTLRDLGLWTWTRTDESHVVHHGGTAALVLAKYPLFELPAPLVCLTVAP
eukprot:3809227-Karenia_brevis.AAC.1